MIRLVKLTRAETSLRKALAALRAKYQEAAKPESLAIELGITYDKACELLLHYDNEQVIRQAQQLLGLPAKPIGYLPRRAFEESGLLVINPETVAKGVPFVIEDLCDEDD